MSCRPLWLTFRCLLPQAHSWTALGKLCLVDEKLAKACVPHFARQLREASLPAVRNNIAVGLTDMCIAYTGGRCCCQNLPYDTLMAATAILGKDGCKA